MHKIVRYLFLALLLLTAGGIPLMAEETLPPKLQTLADEAIHKAVEEFVGGAEPSDDLTKMCIKMN